MGRKATHACARCGASAAQKALKKEGDKLVHRDPCTPAIVGPNVAAAMEARADARDAAADRAAVEAPAEKKPRVNRRGKPTVESETARTCRVCECGCSVGKSCDMGAGRTCCWTSANTPPEGDTCLLCAELIDAAEEAIEKAGGKVPDGLAAALYENCDAPALGDDSRVTANARLGACIEIAVARRTPSKKDRPRTAKKPAPEAPAQATPPHSEEARTLTLPMGREPLAVVPADRGACEACGVKLTRENSSKLPSGRVVHVGCAAVAPSSDLRAPCTDCGAEQGSPCAHATPEPASYIHDARLALLPAFERAVSRRRAAEDRIRVALDEHARIPGDPPVPARDGLVRALVVPGDFDVFTLRDVLGAMIERGEVCELESDRVPGAKYLRRAPCRAVAPPVVMGRVAVRASEAGEEWTALAEMDRAARASCGCEHPAIQHTAEGCAACPCGHEAARIDREEAEGLAQVVGAKAREPAADVVGQALTIASGAQAVASLSGVEFAVSEEAFRSLVSTGGMGEHPAPIVDESAAEPFALCPKCFACIPKAGDTDDIAALLSERPDERLAAQLGAAASHVEDLATFVRHAAEALQALRAEARAVSEALAEERLDRANERESLRAELATAKDLARLASLETADAKDESRALRGALANIVEALGGTVPENDGELISEAVSRARRPRSEPLRGALRDVIGELGGELAESPTDEQLCVGAITAASNALKAVSDLSGQVEAVAAERDTARSERDIAQGDARSMAGRVMRLRAFIAPLAGLPAPHEVTDHELIAAAEGRIPVLVAVAEGAIGELTGASATSAKPIAEQLREAVRATAAKLAVRRMRVPGATPETDTQPKPRVVF